MTRRRPFLQATPLPAPERPVGRLELLVGSLVGFGVLLGLCIALPGIPT